MEVKLDTEVLNHSVLHGNKIETESKICNEDAPSEIKEGSLLEKNIEAGLPSTLKQNEQTQPHNMLGNRLGGNGWSGWSSQFKEDEHDGGEETPGLSSQTPTPLQKEDFKSFDSLLKVYGNKTETLSPNDISKDVRTDSLLPVDKEINELNSKLMVCQL